FTTDPIEVTTTTTTAPTTTSTTTSTTTTTAPTACDIVPFTSAANLVTEQYVDLAQRQPTTLELNTWSTAIDGGNCAADTLIAQLVPTSQTSTIAKVVRLYLAYFNRSPDLGGLNYWIDQIDNHGKTIDTASNQFAHMIEFTTTYGSLTNAQFVNLVYNNVLDRDGDPPGIAYWTGRLDSKARTRGSVMTSFSEAQESRGKETNKVEIVELYLGMLLRTPTTLELTDAAATSGTTEDVLAAAGHLIRHSTEYDNRVN
ncbi:MAG TPA: DUF4214 domain-containing protein, partial [Acidimicrobiales bacterium]